MSTAVLTAVKALILPSYTRTYRIPDDRAAVVANAPFVIVEEMPNFPSRTVQNDAIGLEFQSYWSLMITVFAYKGFYPPGTVQDAAAKTAAWAARDAVRTILLNNPTLSGTVDYIGTAVTSIDFESTATELEWNEEEYFGVYFGVPLKETIT